MDESDDCITAHCVSKAGFRYTTDGTLRPSVLAIIMVKDYGGNVLM